MILNARPHLVWLLALVLAAGEGVSSQPQITSMQRGQARQMLRTIRDAVQKDYYDPAYHGLDVAEHFKAAETKIETVESMGRAYAVIAQAMIDLGDSHTYFLPPQVPAQFEYGWQMAIVGDRCLVLGVKPGSDAETKGLRAGDRILETVFAAPAEPAAAGQVGGGDARERTAAARDRDKGHAGAEGDSCRHRSADERSDDGLR
jgi:hypothetical protein